eukprot:CAMPEP_0173432696 /NCGR_PEP_ID=MMETSP1357-20121228/10408_1 /TAXON_ID=77926 /ORGANISM="Hemiselmis rufescens, Strain PCC563" /LENGTH=253 /DNA_ID=CAMNT_0014397331 /DNA_START=38 /DNA_END=799 /DNA_ORIENTATION=+
MALFEAYEDQLKASMKDLEDKVERLQKPHTEGEEELVRGANQDVEEAEEVLAKMEMEIRSVKSDTKAKLQAKVRLHKESLGETKETLRLRSARVEEAANRSSLMGGRGGGGEEEYRVNVRLGKSEEQRSRMVAATERLEGASERLQESRKALRETEAIGEDVMLDLRQQRETLLHARDGMREVDDNLDASRRVVRQMARRIQQNKRVMYFAGCFFVAMLLIILVMKLKPDGSERATPVPVPSSTPKVIGTPPP